MIVVRLRSARKPLFCGLTRTSVTELHTSAGIRLRNSLVSAPASLSPSIVTSDENALTWYSCGPTVYDAAHIGHARTYVCTDIIRRILTDIHHKDVNFAVGVTDIDDKIIERAAVNGLKNWSETERMVRELEEDFFTDLDALNVRRPDAILRVTEHIPDIIAYIEGIISSERAYVTPDGVYFSVASCGNSYLQFMDLEKANAAEASNTTENTTEKTTDSTADGQNSFSLPPIGNKKDRRDFALWKTVKKGEPFWDSPWGPGRPGWHIECSAVTHSYFGSKIDIHSGGIDLQFPHHTNEIAQCSAYNCTAPSNWVKFWLHTGHLYIEGRKMSKSLKNFISIQDYLNGSYSLNPAADFRIFCLQYKYHSAVHFSQTRIDEAGALRRKIENYLRLSDAVTTTAKYSKNRTDLNMNLNRNQSTSSSVTNIPISKSTLESKGLRSALSKCQNSVRIALADDFDTPEVLKCVSYLIGDALTYASLVSKNPSNSNDKMIIEECSGKIEGSSAGNTASNTGKIHKNDQIVLIQPVEPLIAVTYYVKDLMKKLGVDFQDQKSIVQKSGDNIPSFSNGSQSATETALLESLLAFRSKVRTSSVNCLKSIKSENKKKKVMDDKSVDLTADIARTGLNDVLTACDALRLSIGEELGLRIEDYEGVSIWRPVEAAKTVKIENPTEINN